MPDNLASCSGPCIQWQLGVWFPLVLHKVNDWFGMSDYAAALYHTIVLEILYHVDMFTTCSEG